MVITFIDFFSFYNSFVFSFISRLMGNNAVKFMNDFVKYKNTVVEIIEFLHRKSRKYYKSLFFAILRTEVQIEKL